MRGRRHFVIGDHHARPGQNNEDTRMIGCLIEYLLPDEIIDIGDFYDMPSCSHWDREGADFGQESIAADIEAGNASRAILNKHIRAAMKRNPRWKPNLTAITGNHEHRLDKLLGQAQFSRFRDCIPAFNLEGWDKVEFLKPKWIDGIGYIHYLPTGRMAKPASNARLMHRHSGRRSVVAGHSHEFDLYTETDSFGKQTGAVQVGCSFLHDEEYNPLSSRYWRGVTHLVDVKDGSFGVDQWSFGRIAETL
jgi:hypothetical protein